MSSTEPPRGGAIKPSNAGFAAQHATNGARDALHAAGPDRDIWSRQYSAKKGDIPLCIYRKRLGAPSKGEPPRPVVFFVHGTAVSSFIYDLSVRGKGEYSLMNAFARYGFDCWTMDHENYGRSGRTQGNSNIASGVDDLRVATDVIAQETGQTVVHFVGESSGALRAGAFAMAEPGRAGRLVFGSFTYTGKGSPGLAKAKERLDYFRSQNMVKRDHASIRGNVDKQGIDPEIMDALADEEMKFGDQSPTGPLVDVIASLPIVIPEKVFAPVLLLQGERERVATIEDLQDFFVRLPNPDRQMVFIPGASHPYFLTLERGLYWHVVRAFLDMPPRSGQR